MAHRSSVCRFGNSRSGSRGNGYKSNHTSSRGTGVGRASRTGDIGRYSRSHNDVSRRHNIEPRKNENNSLDSRGKQLIKLECPHCKVTYNTFKKYESHLLEKYHQAVLTMVDRRKKYKFLMHVRDLHKKQKIIDDKATEENPNVERNMCELCGLSFKQPKSEHFSSDSHKKTKKLLQRSCNVCHLIFSSSVRYEDHLCSIEHLKKVNNYECFTKKRSIASPSTDEVDSDVDMDDFLVLDSVGPSDDDESDENENTQNSKYDDEKNKKIKSKKEISLGEEFCKKIKVFYCELCKIHLPPHDDVEQQLNLHCRNNMHLQRYKQYFDENISDEETDDKFHKRNYRSDQSGHSLT